MLNKSFRRERYSNVIKELVAKRKQQKLSQKNLALKIGKPQSFVSKFENSERKLDVVEFVDICQVLGVSPIKILKKIIDEK